MYRNPVYYEASDAAGKDVIGKEQVNTTSPPIITNYKINFYFTLRLWIILFMEYTVNRLMIIFTLLLMVTVVVMITLVWTMPAMMY